MSKSDALLISSLTQRLARNLKSEEMREWRWRNVIKYAHAPRFACPIDNIVPNIQIWSGDEEFNDLTKERLADNAAAVDLLEKMLALFHQERITAEQALNHRFLILIFM